MARFALLALLVGALAVSCAAERALKGIYFHHHHSGSDSGYDYKSYPKYDREPLPLQTPSQRFIPVMPVDLERLTAYDSLNVAGVDASNDEEVKVYDVSVGDNALVDLKNLKGVITRNGNGNANELYYAAPNWVDKNLYIAGEGYKGVFELRDDTESETTPSALYSSLNYNPIRWSNKQESKVKGVTIGDNAEIRSLDVGGVVSDNINANGNIIAPGFSTAPCFPIC